MKNKFNVSIIGTGALGTALAYLILKNGHNLNVFEPNKNNLHSFLTHPKIKKYNNITSNKSINDCISNNYDFIIPCIPSKNIDSFYKVFFESDNKKSSIISISKGLYPNSTKTISQQINSIINMSKFSVLSGPTFANEIIDEFPTYATLASSSKNNFIKIQQLLETENFKLKSSSNLVETELSGILKNCYSITLGIIDHYYGMNTKSLTIIGVRNEIKNLFQKLKLDTNINNLAFLGDYIATGLNPESRNTAFGHILKYKKNTTIEGADNIKHILSLAKSNKIKLPILRQTQKIISHPTKTNIKKLASTILEAI